MYVPDHEGVLHEKQFHILFQKEILIETFFSVRDAESVDDYFGIELPMK